MDAALSAIRRIVLPCWQALLEETKLTIAATVLVIGVAGRVLADASWLTVFMITALFVGAEAVGVYFHRAAWRERLTLSDYTWLNVRLPRGFTDGREPPKSWLEGSRDEFGGQPLLIVEVSRGVGGKSLFDYLIGIPKTAQPSVIAKLKSAYKGAQITEVTLDKEHPLYEPVFELWERRDREQREAEARELAAERERLCLAEDEFDDTRSEYELELERLEEARTESLAMAEAEAEERAQEAADANPPNEDDPDTAVEDPASSPDVSRSDVAACHDAQPIEPEGELTAEVEDDEIDDGFDELSEDELRARLAAMSARIPLETRDEEVAEEVEPRIDLLAELEQFGRDDDSELAVERPKRLVLPAVGEVD